MKSVFILIVTVSGFLVVTFSSIPSSAFAEVSIGDENNLRKALAWNLIPGGGHFYLGEPDLGAAYLASTLSFSGAGLWLDRRNEKLGRDKEVNTFWLFALKEWELSFFTTYRSAIRAQDLDPVAMGVDDIPVKEMFLSPFRTENISDPMVVMAGLLGIAAAVYDSRNVKESLGSVTRIGILGADANRECGTGVYAMDAFALSLGAGVGEEAFWRGIIQNGMEARFGKTRGLWYTASLFGAGHLIDLDGEIRFERVIVATIGGLYLGHMYQKSLLK